MNLAKKCVFIVENYLQNASFLKAHFVYKNFKKIRKVNICNYLWLCQSSLQNFFNKFDIIILIKKSIMPKLMHKIT